MLQLLLLNECLCWNTHIPMLEHRAQSLATEANRYQAFDELYVPASCGAALPQ